MRFKELYEECSGGESTIGDADIAKSPAKIGKKILKKKNKVNESEIFIRLSTKKEENSPTQKRKAFNSFKEKPGYEVVYKPYGKYGRGFYYYKK